MANNDYQSMAFLFGTDATAVREAHLQEFVQNIQPIDSQSTVEGEYQSFQHLMTLLYPDPSQIPMEVQHINGFLQTSVQSYQEEEKELEDINKEIQQKQNTILMLQSLNKPTISPSP